MWNYGNKSQGRPFQKGRRPWNCLPVGAERVTSAGFIEVKISQPGVWKLKHLVVWEKAYGPLPEGQKIEFIDGDRQNVCLENIRLAPRRSQIGDERVGSRGLIEVKIAAKRWRLKHILLWEQAHGPLPKTHVLYFADGDKFNLSLDNLVPFPKNGRIAAEMFQFLSVAGPASGSPAEVLDRLGRQTRARAARAALGIHGALFLQLEYLQTASEADHVSYRQ
jgi:hypothetical protein